MANLTITAASVAAGADATVSNVTWGATVTAGQAVYKDTSDNNEWKPADVDTIAPAGQNGIGIALNGGADGQPGRVITKGDNFVPGATLAVGTRYYVSDSGAIMPHGDLATNDFVTLLFVATTTTVAKLRPIVTNIQVP